jgi:hypothetical protein
VLSGALSVSALGGLVYNARMQHRKTTLLSSRRDIRRAERDRSRAEFEATALRRLDYLSRQEIGYVSECLRKNEQRSRTTCSAPVANLQAAGA